MPSAARAMASTANALRSRAKKRTGAIQLVETPGTWLGAKRDIWDVIPDSTLVLEDEIEKNLSYLVMQKHTGLTIEVHPILYAYLTKGIPSRRLRWSWKYRQKIGIKPNSNYHLTEFHFYDKSDEEIKL